MENFAKKLAINHNITKKSNKKTYPLKSLKEDYEIISKAFDVLTESVSKNVSIPPAGEWLLDNFYIIEEQYNSILNELKLKEYINLPSTDGEARIYLIAKEIVKYTDGNITEEIVENFINAYSSKRTLMMDEIWNLPLMLRIALIKHIREVSDKIIKSQFEKFKVESILERLVVNKEISSQKFREYRNVNLNGEILSYVEYMIYSLKKLGRDGEKFLEILEEEIIKAGTTSSEIVRTEHFDMAVRRISMSNSILSMKNISKFNFAVLFEKINNIETILMIDEVYKNMDFETRNMYREEIKKLSKKTNLSEIYIVNKLIELYKREDKHIGYFLFGEEKEILYRELDFFNYKKELSNNKKLIIYILSIYIPVLIISVLVMKKYFWVGVIPFSEILVTLVNKIFMKMKKTKLLPRLDKIDENINTFVIVPTLLNSTDRVKNLIKDLEVYYLANKESKLKLCLLGDASEIDEEVALYDEEIKRVGIEEVNKLNEKYGDNIFHFIYRKRLFNESQGKWLGYERKRGMITEFNNFLLTGEQGTFVVNTIKEIPKVKYVITLDADTELVLDSAKKLIGIMEHPLNTPVIKNGIVVKGYGLIQPKIGVSIESSTTSLFSKLYAGSGGLDMYSVAESNLYQDLFGEAIFTGKGIYNVEVFQSLLKDEIPENMVLSHDLLEGSYLRVGLATDVELIDGFPSRVNSYMLRLQRWTRGDWQIIRWFKNKKINNVSKYKIFDNLRRSILSLGVLLLFFFGYFKSALIVLFFPFIIDFFEMICNFKSNFKKSKNFFLTISGISASFYRCVMELIFLSYKAILLVEAIIITLYRMNISKKHLLEWVTAADAENLLGKNLKCYLKEMIVSPVIGILLVGVTLIFHSEFLITSITLFIAWTLTPFISFWISKTNENKKIQVKENEKALLLDVAKRTWQYFSEYMNKENNFLPPDNYQESRKRKIAKNTSSTNIGLRITCDYNSKRFGFYNK